MNPVEQVNYLILSTGKTVTVWCTATSMIDVMTDPPFAVLHHIGTKVIVWCIATGIIDVMADSPSAVLHHIGTKMNPQSLL